MRVWGHPGSKSVSIHHFQPKQPRLPTALARQRWPRAASCAGSELPQGSLAVMLGPHSSLKLRRIPL